MWFKSIYLLFFILICCACKGQQQEKSGHRQRSFEMITVPDSITQPDDRAIYVAMHYWDTFDFTDTMYIHLPEITEQAFSNYLSVMQYVPKETAALSIREMMHKAVAEHVMFTYFAGLYEKYLYDLDSPLHDESLFIYALEAMIQEPVFDEFQKIRPAHLLELALKNRIGDSAVQFDYTLANEKQGSLYDVKADYLLLFFYQPDCHTCMETTEKLTGSNILNKLLELQKLQILAVYPGEDFYSWKSNLSYMPSNWIHAYDHTGRIRGEEIYDLKTSSTLYLLDKEKKVLLKDTKIEQIEQFLQKNVQ